jgi:hypothetical protein
MNQYVVSAGDDPKPDFKWPVAVEQRIGKSKEKVWEVISMPGNLEQCHPFCRDNPVQVWPGSGSRDEVHYFNDLVFERRFCEWIDGVGYDLEIGKPKGRSSFVSWRILPIDNHNCTLRIAVYPYLFQHIPVAIRMLPYRLYISPMLRKYLSSVIRGVEWYALRGEPVPQNQFGSHLWFSAPKTYAIVT